MDKKFDEIIKTLEEMKIADLNELVKRIEDHFGVVAAAAVAAPAGGAAEAAEKTAFTVVVTAMDASKKVALIKEVKEITGAQLMEAKKMVEALPATIKENVATADAEALKEKLTAAGATVELK
ncbi:50S ribosomal protein L7/L12 [Spiroplasma endosymbiont of Anurida maritima]|uniref:50S ribosomal protein L7/L12 n=1 Tax=Spiroplasma endosymbiont of Anurida maritima TaxID=2967972 RepID=UPI0036D2925E